MNAVDTDEFLTRTYSEGTYNCMHFAAELWLALTGVDIQDRLNEVLHGPLAGRVIGRRTHDVFRPLDEPQEPCLVLMQHTRRVPHVGVYLRERVMHLGDRRTGVQLMPLCVATLGFSRVRLIIPT